jgi:hypothetical protein
MVALVALVQILQTEPLEPLQVAAEVVLVLEQIAVLVQLEELS